MATEAASQPVEDDEAWLYGDENKKADQTSSVEKSASAPGKDEKKDDREAGELSGEEESQEKDDDDDDSDDDVQVTIGDIQTFPLNEAPRNLFKAQGGYQKTSGSGTVVKPQGTSSAPQKGVDIDALGTINGIPTYDYDLDTLDEKPWRKPGADITDYFNYGFNEETWQQYCEKQRRLRADNQSGSRIYSHQSGSTTKKESLAPPGTETPQNVPVLSGRKPQPVAPRKMSGTIDVIGGTARDSRRPEGEPIQVAGRKTYTSSVPSHPPPGMPDYSIPPPGVPPPGLPPPGMHHPPPGLGVPPPGVPPGVPPPGFPPEYDPFYPPPGQPPSSRYDERTPYGYEASHTTYTTPYTDTHTSSWDRTEAYWRDYVGRDRSPPRSDSEFSSSGSERDYRYRETSSSSRRHERDRDSYRRDRDRDSTRDRDRDRSRERERTRDHRHRDDKHKSRRKDKDEDSDHHRAKHKKSKRSKRDREEDYDSTNPQDSLSKTE